jgi:hypothetical protein
MSSQMMIIYNSPVIRSSTVNTIYNASLIKLISEKHPTLLSIWYITVVYAPRLHVQEQQVTSGHVRFTALHDGCFTVNVRPIQQKNTLEENIRGTRQDIYHGLPTFQWDNEEFLKGLWSLSWI